MSDSHRKEVRNLFFSAWEKYQTQLPLEPLEKEIVRIILQHPEYHLILKDPERYQEKDFIQGNPFLHLSLHLAIYEQISTDRPQGIKILYQKLCEKFGDCLVTEHRMIECLEKVLWEAQTNNMMPDEGLYIESLERIL